MAESTAWCISSISKNLTGTKMRSLSGGNQQKSSSAVLLPGHSLLLDEPTRGIDVGAKYEIYRSIQKLPGEGKTLFGIFRDAELSRLCDRILVMSGGRLAGE